MAASFLLILVLYGSYYSFGVFLKPMIIDLGWTRAMTTGVISVYMMVHGVSSVITGSLSDKYGPRFVVAFCTFLVALGYIIMAGITIPRHLYLYFGLMVGAGMGAAYVPPVAAVTRWFTSKTGLALGIVASGVGFGQMLYPPFIRYLISSYGWRISFAVMGVIIGLIGIPSALFLKHPPANPVAHNKPSSHIAKIKFIEPKSQNVLKTWKIVRRLPFLSLLFIFMSLVFGISTIMAHIVAHVEDAGFNPMQAALIITFIGGSGIAGRIIIGSSADRVGSRIMLAACLTIQAMLFFGLIFVEKLWIFYLFGILYGLTYGGALPNIIILNTKFFGTDSGGKIFGILFFGAMIGGAAGAPISGYIYDVTNEYSIAFCIGGILLLAASILSITMKERGRNNLSNQEINW